MKINKIINGIAALLVIAAILLLSDLNNRVSVGKGDNQNKNKCYKFCLVHYSESAIAEDVEKGVRDELKNQGLTEGEDFTLKVYSAQGDMGTLNGIAEAVISEKWDLVFIASTPTLQVFSKKSTNLPIVFSNTGDPIGAGVGESFEKHLPNITGICTTSDFEGMVDLVLEIIPGIKSIGTIYTPGEINSVKYIEQLSKAATAKGLKLVTVPANSATEIVDAAMVLTTKNIGAITQIVDNLTSSSSETIIKQAYNNKIPYLAFISNQLDKGAIAAVARDFHQAGVDAVRLGIQILNGKSPNEIPIRNVSRTIVQFNDDAMKHFNLKIPDKYRTNQDQPVNDQKKPFKTQIRMAIVHYVASPDCEDVAKGILSRMKELGHEKGSDFIFDEYNANADIATLNNIVNVIADKKYDLIFPTVLATTQALSSKIKDVPILFTVVADPVSNGLGTSYTNHIKNITGIDGMSYTDKGIDLVKAYMPNVKSLGALYCPGEMASISSIKELEKSCKKNNIQLITVPVNSVSEVTDATSMLCMKKIDAICQTPDNCTIPGFSSMVKVTRKQNMPLFCFISSQVQMGAIAAIAGDYFQQGKEIADVSIQIINGKSPSEIPFSRIQQIKTVINTVAAKAYGLETPKELLISADQIIKE